MRLLHFGQLHLHSRPPEHAHVPELRTENRLSHRDPAPESLPAHHCHLAFAPLSSLNQFPGPLRAAHMRVLKGRLPSPTAHYSLPMRRAFLIPNPEPLPQLAGKFAVDSAPPHPNRAGLTSASLSRRQCEFDAVSHVPPMTPRQSAPRRRLPNSRPIWPE